MCSYDIIILLICTGMHGSYQLDDVEASSEELFGSRRSSSTQQSGTPSRGSQQHSNLPENINMVYEELAAISDKLKVPVTLSSICRLCIYGRGE